MPTIQLLSQSMINKIAAGEVIERPASVVKELVENSVDAGANRIDIEVEKGGTELLRIVDNGCGIARDQLLLALSPHATSKIVDTDDLFRVLTFGFRGEALASIAEISQLILRSRTADANEGAEIRSNGGTFSEPIPCGMPVGTAIEVGNLFFNTPVRRKYMRSITTEFGHILETIIRVALPQPQIHFTLKHNKKIVHDLPAENKGTDRIAKLFGAEVAENLIYVESRRGDISVFGHVGHPKVSRSNNKLQYFFLNGRYIRDRALQHALSEAYRGLLMVGRFRIAFLQVEMPAELYDVNVHPTKMEVRFLDSQKIYSNFLGAIRERFLSIDMNSTVSAGDLSKHASPIAHDPRKAIDEDSIQKRRAEIADWAKKRVETLQAEAPDNKLVQKLTAGQQAEDFDVNRALEESFNRDPFFADFYEAEKKTGKELQQSSDWGQPKPTRLEFHTINRPPIRTTTPTPPQEGNHSPPVEGCPIGRGGFRDQRSRKVIQVHDRYLIVETEKGVGIIDQHAMHERILYEKLKNRFASGKIDSQRLLVPMPLDLAPTEYACALDNKELLSNLGLAFEPFGGETVLLTGYPAILEKVDPQDLLLGLLDTLLDSSKKPTATDLCDEMLQQMACKAAVKAGEKLRPDAMEQLLEFADKEINSHHCPHGRPSVLVFTCDELDKMFKR